MKTLELKNLDIKVLDEQSLISTSGGIYPVVLGFIITFGALCAFSGLTVPVMNYIWKGNNPPPPLNYDLY